MKLGLDFGTSITKGALVHKGKFIAGFIIDKNEKPDAIIKKIIKKYPITEIYTTRYEINSSIMHKKVKEIESIAKGAKSFSGQKKGLAVSLGTGICMVSFGKEIKHIGGSSLGGGAIYGLSQLFDIKDPVSESKKGDLSKTSLLIKDLYPNGIEKFKPNDVASFLSNIKNPSKYDIAVLIVDMVCQSIGSIIGFASKGCDTIILVGTLASIPKISKLIKKRILQINKNVKIIIPQNAEFATAYGATL